MKKKIIYGYGKTGKSVAEFFKKKDIEYIVVDGSNNKDNKILNPNDFIDWDKYDELIISPGINPKDSFVQKAISNNIVIKNEIQLAYENLKDPYIICVTGTNGKSTTTSMIYEMLKNKYNNVYIAGNFGIPLIDHVLTTEPKSKFVIELSSYQIETLTEFKSNISLFLNITPDHLERHGSFEEYKKTKEKLECFTTESVFYSNDYIFNIKELKDFYIYEKDFFIKDNNFYFCKKKIYSDITLNIPGRHNLENLSFCLGVMYKMGVDLNTIKLTLKNYQGLEHRMEYVGKKGLFKVYNDSKSTTFESTEAAVESFDSNIYVIISGVLKKHMEIDVFLKKLSKMKKIKKIIVLGKVVNSIAENNDSEKLDLYDNYNWNEVLVDILNKYSKEDRSKKILLFSPGMPSFDNFKNFEERGDFFKKSVKGILDEEKKKY